MVLNAPQCSCNGRQTALGGSYGFPPLPGGRTVGENGHTLNTPLLPPSFISPPTTPLPVLSHQCVTQLPGPQTPNIADYLAKKRLYNSLGSILRPACGKLIYAFFIYFCPSMLLHLLIVYDNIESCHAARKKCDVERPCTRCIKNVIPCIERQRSKRRKVQQRSSYQKQPPVNIIPIGLPSPVSEPPLDTRAHTPMELDHTSTSVARSVDDTFNTLSCNTPITPIGPSDTGVMGDPSDPSDPSDLNLDISIGGLLHPGEQDFHDVPPPIGNYLEGISLISSEAPIFGLEGNDPLIKRNFWRVLDNDLSIGDEKHVVGEGSNHSPCEQIRA